MSSTVKIRRLRAFFRRAAKNDEGVPHTRFQHPTDELGLGVQQALVAAAVKVEPTPLVVARAVHDPADARPVRCPAHIGQGSSVTYRVH